MKSFLRCLALITALCVGWSANAQELEEYVYSTGIDASKWITLTDYTDVSGTGSGDSWASSVMNIGFNFPFGDVVYTQYSVNSDGNLRLGSTVTGTNNYGTPFSSSSANTNNPKINFFGCDGYLVSGTHYIHSQNFGDSLLVVEYCLGPFSSTYRNNQFNWQVHLYSNGKIEAVFASASNLSSSNSHYMGICNNASDGWIINSSSVASFFTNGVTSTSSWSSTTWPTPYTYFTFVKPVITCPRPTLITVSNVTATSAYITFTPGGTETSWIATLTDGVTSVTTALTDTIIAIPPTLAPNTEYTVAVRAICGVGDTSAERSTTFHTDCVPLTLADLPYVEDFESYGTGSAYSIDYCWTRGTNSTTAYPYPYSSAAINGSRGLYFYGYRPSSASGTWIYSYAALPELASSININGLTLRFNAKRYGTATTYYHTVFHLGVMTDPNDLTTFDTLETYNLSPLPASTVVNIERELNDYTGTGRYIAILVPPLVTEATYTYNYLYLDDVELMVTPTCRRATELAISNVTYSSATVSWTPATTDQDTFVVAYGTGTNPDSLTSVVVTGTTSLTMSALNDATQYNVFVKAVCSATDESEWSASASFFTMQIPVPVTTTNFFKDDFEGNVNWLFANDALNKWAVGTAVNNGGEKALYISNNYGASNVYSTGATQWTYAQKALTLGEGQYVVSFDWKATGESNYDYLRAFLVPANITITAGMPPVPDAAPYSFRTTTPAGWISLDGSSKLNQQSSWVTRVDTANIATAGDYNLVFLWVNDGSGGSQPPAAIDNVKMVYKPANATMVTLANADPTMGYTIPEPDNYYFAVDDTMRATAIPYPGHQFDYWEVNLGPVVDSIALNPLEEVVPAYMANMTINATAHFSERTYTLTVVSNNTLLGSVTGSGTYSYLDTVTITATPNSGYRFLGWNDGDTNLTRTVVVTSDSTFTALFDYQPVTVTLTVANPAMGTTIPAPGTYTFSVGDTMRATAIPNQYHRFVSWTLSAMSLSEDVTMNPVSEVVPVFLAGLSFNITCNFEEYHLPAFDSIYTFEDTTADSSWTLINGTVTNQWAIGNAISNGGSRSLYVTNDGGVSNAYTNNSTSFSYATIGGWMELGVYNISYDWKCNGESSYDYMRAFLAPIDREFTAGQTPIGTTSSNGFINTVPDGLIPLDGGTKKNLSTNYNTFTAEGVAIANRGEYKIVFMWANDGSAGSQPPASVDNITVTMPDCPAPTSLAATDITSNSATLSWFALPGVTNYTVEYGYDTTAATMAMVSGNTALLAGLIDNTTYYFRVLYTCGDDIVSSGWASFTTLCTAIAPSLLPYTENFDSYTTSTTSATGIEPNCWTLAHTDVAITSSTYLPQIYYGSSNAHSGNYSLRLYYRCIYAMPAIDTNISALQMGFWVKQTSANYQLVVGVMSNLDDETTFVPVDTIDNTSTSAPEYHEVLFANYSGNGHFIAFRNITTASYNYSYNYIDDIVVDFIPTCPAPTNVTAQLLNASSATVTWTPFDNTMNNFEVAYGTGNDPSEMAIVNSTTASATISGLAAETNYNIYVRAICGPADFGPWSIPASIYTGYCQPSPTSVDGQGITNVTFGTGDEIVNNSQRPTESPYYGDYSAQVGGVQAGDSVNLAITYATGYTYGTIVWVDWNNNLTFDGNEVVYVGTAPNNNPTTLNASFEVPATQEAGTYRMRIAGADSYYDSYTGSIEAAANANPCPTSTYTIVHDYSLHVMSAPALDCGTTCQITIAGEDSYGDGWNGNAITISQNDSVIGTFTLDAGTSYTATTNVCSNYPVVFSWTQGSYSSETSFIIYDGGGAPVYTCTDGSALTDSSLFFTLNNACPTCLVPTVTVDSVTTNSVAISWTDGNSGATYTVYDGTTVVATGITANSYTFTGLTSNIDYTFGVQANCSATDASSIVTVTAHTNAEAITCDGNPALLFANADAATTTTNYFPGYSLYDYSYSEVIIPSERLTGLGEIKGMEFKPTNITNGSSYFNNCEIYMMNTSATSLSDGFIQDTNNFQLVFSGNLSYEDTNWQTVTFNNTFTWNGSDNLLVAVRRNHGGWATSGSFEAFSASSQLARYAYRDGTPYTIGEITSGYATSTVPVYHFLGCGATCQITITGEDSYGDGWNGGFITVSQSGSNIDTFTVSGGSLFTTTIEVSGDAPVQFSWSSGMYDDEVSFTIQDGSGAPVYTCTDGSNLPAGLFYTLTTPCPNCLAPTVAVDTFSNSSATISWTDNNSGATYTVYNDTTVVATGVTANTYTFTGLVGHTVYSLGVQANCSATDASSIIYVGVTTLSDPIMCGDDTASMIANADIADTTTRYFPGYSYYNYSYSEVIIPASRLTGLGEIKGLEFKPTSLDNGSSYFTNCEIYMMNTNATSLANGFIQDTDNLQLVFTGDLSHDNTNWQTVTFDTSFTWNGTSNVLVAVRRNHGSYATSGYFEAFTSTDTLARYVYRDGSAYPIGEITGGTATTYVPVYHLIGCEGQAPSGVIANIAVNDTTMGTTIPAPGTYTINLGDTIGAYAVANTGYHFDYWTVSILGFTDTITTNPIADVVPAYMAGVTFDITAYFAPDMYTITANANDSTMGTVTGSGSYAYGTTATLTATPATGYHFVQWNDADTHATRTITVTGNATYTATFAPDTYTITVLANNALLGTVTGGGTYTYGATATLTATPATNCHFVQWNDADTHATRTVTVTGDATYTATFAYDPLTVTLAVNDTAMGTTNPAPGIYTFNVGDTITATALAATGHSFQTWSISGVTLPNLNANPLSVVIPAEAAGMSINVTAMFTVNNYTITVVANDSTRGTVTGSGTYAYGTEVTITATPAQHYYLMQWSDGDTHLTRTITVTHDATYTATFRARPQHTVIVNASVGGTVTGSGLYYEDDIVTISATPDEYYAFVSWVDPNQNVVYTEPTVTFPMSTTDIVLTALFEQVVFEASLDVTINNLDWGHVLINGERTEHYHGHTGDTITLQAVANEGYHFDHWDGVHPVDDTELGETVTIILTDPATDVQCYFAENVSINDVVEDNTIIYTKHNNIVVSGAEQQTIRVFDVVGRLVAQRSNAAVEETIPMPATGVYLVKVGDRPAHRVVVRK